MENAVVQSKCGKCHMERPQTNFPSDGLNKPKTKNNHIADKKPMLHVFPFCVAEPKDSFLATMTLQKQKEK